jgi:hypothetical protein
MVGFEVGICFTGFHIVCLAHTDLPMDGQQVADQWIGGGSQLGGATFRCPLPIVTNTSCKVIDNINYQYYY